MPEYRIAPDQGVCPDGHPCTLSAEYPIFRECPEPTHFNGRYVGEALVDVYVGPVSVEAYHEATAALRELITSHENAHDCPGAEACIDMDAARLRALQDALDPLPRAETRRCEACGCDVDNDPHADGCPCSAWSRP